jgi:hypothetical protein
MLPKDAALPLEKGNHPELDSSDLLDLEGIKIYQSLIGALQWVIQIGQFDITTAGHDNVMLPSSPQEGTFGMGEMDPWVLEEVQVWHHQD